MQRAEGAVESKLWEEPCLEKDFCLVSAMNPLTFVTGNREKLTILKNVLKQYDIEVVNLELDPPEIQSSKVEDVAEYSVTWACNRLGRPCVVSDVGCYVEALKGFPGPFVKFVNQMLTADQLLKLMEGESNRKALFRECISYCAPNGTPKSFVNDYPAIVVEEAGGDKRLLGKPTPFNEILKFEGCNKVLAEYSYEEALSYFKERQTHLDDFARWYTQQK